MGAEHCRTEPGPRCRRAEARSNPPLARVRRTATRRQCRRARRAGPPRPTDSPPDPTRRCPRSAGSTRSRHGRRASGTSATGRAAAAHRDPSPSTRRPPPALPRRSVRRRSAGRGRHRGLPRARPSTAVPRSNPRSAAGRGARARDGSPASRRRRRRAPSSRRNGTPRPGGCRRSFRRRAGGRSPARPGGGAGIRVPRVSGGRRGSRCHGRGRPVRAGMPRSPWSRSRGAGHRANLGSGQGNSCGRSRTAPPARGRAGGGVPLRSSVPLLCSHVAAPHSAPAVAVVKRR
ncbi:hypothetical protein NONO_c50440 [Nocardia nova SH22a]|uniref:Uncharacterized protein n=1 Tax=Nocardia nova SH22a TaxID=1415166 RepID=W5TLJ3_9NOCA|nr:hypothetical protein NONO_c50440 [Nocardia nova SH22a]